MAKTVAILSNEQRGVIQPPTTSRLNYSSMDPVIFQQIVEARAFYKAEQRGFEPGHELEDWIEAEQELLNDTIFFDRKSEY